VEHCRDAVGQHLPVGIDERDVEVEADARPRHHLPLEGIAMNVDDARQHDEAVSIDAAARRGVAADRADYARRRRQMEGGALERVADEDASALDANVFGTSVHVLRSRFDLCGGGRRLVPVEKTVD
jgi:hypothetical protein